MKLLFEFNNLIFVGAKGTVRARGRRLDCLEQLSVSDYESEGSGSNLFGRATSEYAIGAKTRRFPGACGEAAGPRT